MQRLRFPSRATTAVTILAAALVVARCGSPAGPTVLVPSVLTITPSRGPITGGTSVRITGTNFSAGAGVVIGGVNATDVVVESATAIAAKTGPRAAGSADVAVTVSGQTGALPGGFQYEVVQSAPPVVTAVVARGTRANEPAGFADLNEEIAVTATVQDPDTPADQLTFEWAAPAGTFSGTGAAVKWRAPVSAAVPTVIALTVTVIDPANRVTGSTTVSLHDSVKEVGDLSRQFLLEFSDSTIRSPEFVVRNFSTSVRCAKLRQNELEDVAKNREFYLIESSSIGGATVNFQFGGKPCSYPKIDPANGDACAAVPATWASLCLVTNVECKKGERGSVSGIDYVSAVLEDSAWRLCGSSYGPRDGIARPNFIR
jgi:hypothetical protein